VHDQLTVVRGEAAEKLAEALEKFRGLTGTAPLIAIGGKGPAGARRLGRCFSIVKKSWYMGISRARAIFSSVSILGMVRPFSTRET